ncbi:MAG: hypothetical protein M1814_002700 [Vezdaea aestivalis]|nr:MAG: hypothetical protein M1814_002700 [Vezdaea aestivalis]
MRVNPEHMLMQPLSFEKMATKSTRPMSFVGHVPQRPISLANKGANFSIDPSRQLMRGSYPREKMDEPFDVDELCRKLNRYKAAQEDQELRDAQILGIRQKRRQLPGSHAPKSNQRPSNQPKSSETTKPDDTLTTTDDQSTGAYRHRPRFAAVDFQRTATQEPLKAADVHVLSQSIVENIAQGLNVNPTHRRLKSCESERQIWEPVSNRLSLDSADETYKTHRRLKSYGSDHQSWGSSSRQSLSDDVPRAYKPTDRPNWSQEDECEPKEKRRWSMFREKPAATETFVFPPHPAVHPLANISEVPELKKERRKSKNLFKKILV